MRRAKLTLCTLSHKIPSYSLHEPSQETRELYIKNMKKSICQKNTLKHELISSFRTTCWSSAQHIKPTKLTNAILNIAVRKGLNKTLDVREQTVGHFLACVRSVNALEISGDELGE